MRKCNTALVRKTVDHFKGRSRADKKTFIHKILPLNLARNKISAIN